MCFRLTVIIKLSVMRIWVREMLLQEVQSAAVRLYLGIASGNVVVSFACVIHITVTIGYCSNLPAVIYKTEAFMH